MQKAKQNKARRKILIFSTCTGPSSLLRWLHMLVVRTDSSKPSTAEQVPFCFKVITPLRDLKAHMNFRAYLGGRLQHHYRELPHMKADSALLASRSPAGSTAGGRVWAAVQIPVSDLAHQTLTNTEAAREATEHFLKYKTSRNCPVLLQKQQLPEAVNILSPCTVTRELVTIQIGSANYSVSTQISGPRELLVGGGPYLEDLVYKLSWPMGTGP